MKVIFEDNTSSEIFGRESSYPVTLTIPEFMHTITLTPDEGSLADPLSWDIYTMELLGKGGKSTKESQSSKIAQKWIFLHENEIICGVKGRQAIFNN